MDDRNRRFIYNIALCPYHNADVKFYGGKYQYAIHWRKGMESCKGNSYLRMCNGDH